MAWRERARKAIEAALPSIPADVTERERRAVLNAVYPFGPRKHHPYKIWLDEVKVALGKKRRGRAAKEKNVAPEEFEAPLWE